MSETRPTGEQIRFRSSTTGDHILDDYLEAAEKGGRTLPDMLADVFSDSTGKWDQSLFQFRLNPSTNTIEFRNGTYVDPDEAWETLTPFFRNTGTFNSATEYSTYDLITDTNTDVYLVTQGNAQTFATIELMRASANTARIFDISTAAQHKADAESAKTAAETAETNAETAEANAVIARNAAQAAQSLAESARDVAINNSSQTGLDRNATTADRGAVAADKITVAADKATVATYVTTAFSHKSDAEAAAIAANASKVSAETAEDNAVIAKNAAQAAAVGIESIRDQTAGIRDEAVTAKTESEAARDEIDAYLISHTASVVNLTTLFLAYNVYNP